jgi:hypothetical protein
VPLDLAHPMPPGLAHPRRAAEDVAPGQVERFKD